MQKMKDFDRILTMLSKAVQNANTAGNTSYEISEKADYHRVRIALDKARIMIRNQYFGYDNVLEYLEKLEKVEG